jgi:hypothetical protein
MTTRPTFCLVLLAIAFGSVALGADPIDLPLSTTSWGDPDIEGSWSYRTATPLQRPLDLGDRAEFSSDEAALFESTADERFDSFLRSGAIGDYVGDEPWADRGRQLTEGSRASLIIDPPNGRLPRRTPLGKERSARAREQRIRADGPEDRPVSERCLIWPLAPLRSENYNNNLRIVQTPNHIVLATEMIHHARIVPLVRDETVRRARAATPSNRSYLGNSVGYWDGDTLVVETSGFRDYLHPWGTTADMRLRETFTRDGRGGLTYEYTVDDPAAFESAWTARQTLQPLEGRIYEYACHEANHSMELILRAARATE